MRNFERKIVNNVIDLLNGISIRNIDVSVQRPIHSHLTGDINREIDFKINQVELRVINRFKKRI